MISVNTLLIVLALLCRSGLAYDKTLKVSNFALSGCRELISDGQNSFTPMFPIKELKFNKPKTKNELLRSKFYIAGYDTYVAISPASTNPFDDDDQKYYYTVLSGYNRTSSKIGFTYKQDCAIINTLNLTNHVFYTELEVVVTNDGQVSYYQSNEKTPFLTCKMEPLQVTHIGFASYSYEDPVRIFFDCPLQPECLDVYCVAAPIC